MNESVLPGVPDTPDELLARVKRWMNELFGSFVLDEGEDSTAVRVRIGSTIVETSLAPWGDADFAITTRAKVVSGARMEPALLRFLLERNHEVRFGAFSVTPRGDILYSHSLVGSTCDREELRSSVSSVMLVADRFDDEIVTRWGGVRALDQHIED